MGFDGLKDLVKDLTQSPERRAVSKALKLFSKGEIDKAIEVLSEAKEQSPENADILFDLARYLVLANRATEAAEPLRAILRRDPRAYQRAIEMIEELRARHHAVVGPLYDAIADHFIRHDNLKSALDALERMKQEEIRALLPRHRTKWDGLRRSAPDAKMNKASLTSAYYLALCCEALRQYEAAGAVYRTVAQNNPEELPRVLGRLEALLAKNYQDTSLRLAVADLLLLAGREEDAAQQFGIVLAASAESGPAIAGRIEAFLADKGEKPGLRWIVVQARLAGGDRAAALEAMRPLVEAGELLDQVVPALESLAAADPAGPARALLAGVQVRRGQPHAALEILAQIGEERGLAAIREPLESLVAAAPNYARAYHLLADIHLAEGRPTAAMDSLRKARGLAPGEETVLVTRAVKALEADPTSGEGHLLLADLLMQRGERERAIVVLRHLVREAPESAGESLARFAAVIKDDPQAPRARIGAAEACLELKHFPEALRHLADVATSHPQLAAEFLHAVGLLAEAAPDLHAAVGEILKALETRSQVPHAVRFALGEAAFQGGDLAGATAAFREVLAAAPDKSDVIRQALERFDRDRPEGTEARHLLAMLYLDRRDHRAALAELSRGGPTNAALLDRVLVRYEEIVAANPDDLDAKCGLVETLRIARRFDRVLAVGQEILRAGDGAATARVSLAMGDALLEKGDADGAVKRFFAAHGRDPGLGAEVIKRLRGIIESEGTHPLASLALGKVLGSEGQPGEASEALRAAAAADPKLTETVLTEMQKLWDSAPADSRPGLALLLMLRETRDSRRTVQVISTLLDAHPDLASVLAAHLEPILKEDPKQPFATYEMARALQHVKIYPRSAGLYLAAFRLDAGLAPMVLKRLEECIEAAPDCADPYLAAGTIHAARGKFMAAAEKIQQAMERMPAEAEGLLPRLDEIYRQHRGNARLGLVYARACRRAGKLEAALSAFGAAAEKDPACLDAAMEGYEEIIKTNPKLGAAYLERARVLSRRMQADQALADLGRAVRLAPEIVHLVIQEAEVLHARLPESHACALLLADLYMATGKEAEATRLLKHEATRGGSVGERLAVLIRLWRLALARQDDEAARAFLAEAGRLAPDRNQFLARVHEVHVTALRGLAARLRQPDDPAARRRGDFETALSAMVELGDVQAAGAALEAHAASLDRHQAARLRGEICLRRGDYPRALEHLRDLGASRALAFGACRAGDFPLAASTLEALLSESDVPELRRALERVYRDLVAAELMGGRLRLQAETTVTFGEGAAA
jgi:tetratricopeptide (TPR) repeat protein